MWTIVCFSGVSWASHKQRPQWLMSSFAASGHRVLYIDNLGVRLPRTRDLPRVLAHARNWARRSHSETLVAGSTVEVDAPVVLPLQHLDSIRRLGALTLARRIRKRIDSPGPLIVWTYLPLPAIRDCAVRLGADLLVYDWADDASEHALTRSDAHRKRIATWEDETAASSDIVFVASEALLQRRKPRNERTVVVPHGIPNGLPKIAPSPEILELDPPRIGFVGSITEWTNLELIETLARKHPEWSLVLVGPIKVNVDMLRRLPNIKMTGPRPHDEIPAILSALDCGIIPYRSAAAIDVASPVKLREYLSHGLPVVSVDIPEVRSFAPRVALADDVNDFERRLEEAVQGGRKAIPKIPTWFERTEEMATLIGELLPRDIHV